MQRIASLMTSIALAASLGVLASGCARPPEPPEEDPPPPREGRPLEVGEVVTFKVEPNAQWQISPYDAHRGHTLQLRSSGDAALLALEALQCRIGRTSGEPGRGVHLLDGRSFRITQPGSIHFRFDPSSVAPGMSGNYTVEIERIR